MTKCAATISLAFIQLERALSIPLYLQLYEQLRGAILSGQLQAGVRLPSTRDLATNLSVSRNTVKAAFDQLLAEGYVSGKVGAGTYVASVPVDSIMQVQADADLSRSKLIAQPPVLSKYGTALLPMQNNLLDRQHKQLRAFRPCVPALDAFPTEIWSRLMARHWRNRDPALLNYGEAQGYRPLRELIAGYLRFSRAIRCDPDQIVMVSGFQQALSLAARVLLDPGDAVWIEEPGFLGARNVLQSVGATLVPVSVDPEGINVEIGMSKHPTAKLACVTPSHQFPLGVTMSLSRRLALLQWAHQTGAWILEDDYDSEYRYTGNPLSALQALDQGERVIYVGTFSKVLFPSLRLGYLVVPPNLVNVFAAARALSDRHSPLIEQAVLSDFIAEGHFTRHIRRMRLLYAKRQAALVEAAQPLKPKIEVAPCNSGMHLVGWLPDDVDDCWVSGHLAQQGVIAPPLSRYYLEPTLRSGLVLGYTAVDSHQIGEAMHYVNDVLQDLITHES